jgi:hypothetical protein
VESLAKDFKLSACGREAFVIVIFYLFIYFFQVKCQPFKFEEVLSYATPDLRLSSSIVFLDTLGTMCHFSLGVGYTFLSFYLIICVVLFLLKKILLCC